MNHNCYYLGDGLIISMRLTARRPKTDRERVGSSLNETGKSDGREYTNPPPFFSFQNAQTFGIEPGDCFGWKKLKVCTQRGHSAVSDCQPVSGVCFLTGHVGCLRGKVYFSPIQ